MRARGLLAALTLMLCSYVAIDGWWTPHAREGNLRHYHGERSIIGNFRVLTSDALVLAALRPDQRIARAARSALLPRLAMPLSLLGLGLVGAAFGRRRLLTGRAIGLRTILGSWILGWLTASLLGRFGGHQGMFHQPAAPSAGIWLPPLMLFGFGVAAWIALNRLNLEPPLPRRS
jgi:lipopolysaccharide export LptBFGC system permease protein LptF